MYFSAISDQIYPNERRRVSSNVLTRDTEFTFSHVTELGDLAIAAHHSSGTDNDGEDDNVVVGAIGDNDGNDEESFEHKVHVPTRMQLAKQRSRSKLFRGSRKSLQNIGTSYSDISSDAIRRYLTVSC